MRPAARQGAAPPASSPTLVRVPDQFRPGRTPRAATPTCCCCCCCCVATMVTASVVLPIKVEMKSFALPVEARPPRSQLLSSKWIAGLAPVLSMVVSSLSGFGYRNGWFSLVVFLLVLTGMLAMALSPVRKAGLSIFYTALFVAALIAEVVVGGIGVLATAGIGYIVVGGGLAWAIIGTNVRAVRAARAAGEDFPGLPSYPAFPTPAKPPPPPLLPRPPSSEDD